ncbi:MAG: tryptophan--tRNA ligase [Bacteroidota bacterium]
MKKVILSGMRPTGKLHLGHLVGALENWVSLQDQYQNYHLVADYHALTTNLDSSDLYQNSIEMLIDWLSAGIDPVKSPVFRQSQIKEHTELHLIFSMLISSQRLQRNPTLKEQVRDLNMDIISYGHLGYPVLQAADILLYKGEVVPVGEDQAPHVEITREVARKFNSTYKTVFPLPETRLTQFPRLPGLNGIDKRMSKSVGNGILLSDSPDVIGKRVRTAVTDPLKIKRGDPGRPEICLVFTYHKKFNPTEVPQIERDCRSGALGCVDCKANCAKHIIDYLAPLREKRKYYEAHGDQVSDILIEGEKKARAVAQATMREVREAMGVG